MDVYYSPQAHSCAQRVISNMNSYLRTRYLFDFILSLFIIVVVSPVILLVVALQAILYGTSNVFFVQQRIGISNKPFDLLKIKTMSDELNKPECERQTAFGKILRRWGLDELPQLINIIKGDMALIGPRPLLPEYLPFYSTEQMKRHLIKPGIIGLAQANGRNAASWEERLKLDVDYVNSASLKLDFWILMKTMKTLFAQRGNTEMLPRFDDYIRGQASQ